MHLTADAMSAPIDCAMSAPIADAMSAPIVCSHWLLRPSDSRPVALYVLPKPEA